MTGTSFRKPVISVGVDVIKSVYVEQLQTSNSGGSNTRKKSQEIDIPCNTVWKMCQNIMHFFLYKFHYTSQIFDRTSQTIQFRR